MSARFGRPSAAAAYQEVVVTYIPYRIALIVGVGSGISASVARGLASAGLKVGLAARNVEKLVPLATETGAQTFAVDASDPAGVERLFADADSRLGEPDVVLYNASARAHGPIAELDPVAVRKAIEISAFGGFLTVQQAAQRMIPHGRGAILLTGASASVKGYPHSAAFAMGKFALRGLAQSTARELGPKGIHVAHFVIDGGVRSARRPDPADRPDSTLDPEAIAQTYLEVLRQPRSAWSLEVEMRPWLESF
jgi:NAD(P)-dependent dehydrogenase (short-subunit alcohol dehydrogenase family)